MFQYFPEYPVELAEPVPVQVELRVTVTVEKLLLVIVTVVVFIVLDEFAGAELFDDFSANAPAAGVGRPNEDLERVDGVRKAVEVDVEVATTGRSRLGSVASVEVVKVGEVSRLEAAGSNEELDVVGSVRKKVDVDVDVATTGRVERSVVEGSEGRMLGDEVLDSVKKKVDVDVEVATIGSEAPRAEAVVGKPGRLGDEINDAMTPGLVFGVNGMVEFKILPVEGGVDHQPVEGVLAYVKAPGEQPAFKQQA